MKLDNNLIVELIGTTIDSFLVVNISPLTNLDHSDEFSFELIETECGSVSKKVFDEIVENNMKDCQITIRHINKKGVELNFYKLFGYYKNIDFGLGVNKKGDIKTIKLTLKIKKWKK